jgi:[ribosomal protein S5]-alanine N-acetyltransferase
MNVASMTPLPTARLLLRPLMMDDAEALHRIHHEAGTWRYFPGSPLATVEEERAKIEQLLGEYERNNHGLWAPVLRETGELIGRCGLMRRELDGAVEVELGYLLSPRFWGQGLASEAARAIRDHAFERRGFKRLVSIIAPENIASKRVAMAAGMRFSRQTRYNEEMVDVYVIEEGSIVKAG